MQKQNLQKTLQFQGTWRSYQKRVLDRAGEYLKDKKIHIVAAPGSGKTTLGIELIRRLNEPCLILAPSITIREQWIARIKEAYLADNVDTESLLSNSIKKPEMITAITYQALHSSVTKYKGTLKEEEEEEGKETENVDFTDFNLYAVLREIGVKTLCLDEAHHLRSEWWKALEDLVKEMPEMTIISLTATPPYDSTPAQWDRYVGLCGPIDEEIIVPELVKEGSLCPHQDYIYFNMPTKEELQAIQDFKNEAAKVAEEIFENQEFTNIISSHKGLAAPGEYADTFLEKPEYLCALLVFLRAKGVIVSRELMEMLGTGSKMPTMTVKWLELLLQGFLYDDVDGFYCDKEYREKLIAKLKAHGLIQKSKVCLENNDKINKMLTTSKGKMNSILEIIKAEYENLGEDLRLLVLTDFIKKEYISAIGNEEKSTNELGVIPIFETVRRNFSGIKSEKNTTTAGERITSVDLRLGVLCGTIVIIPEAAKEPLETMIKDRGIKSSVKLCGDGGYYQVSISSTEHNIAAMITELFNKGYIRVLIGTKSLLGEGWDSPCINSLVLASFVGAFMLSNQMRGRAIRTMRDNPNKVSNIWHLVCMEPENLEPTKTLKEKEESDDFVTLRRRLEGFLGVHYEKDVIENRMNRMSYVKPPYTGPLLGKINEQMIGAAKNRDVLKKGWEDALAPLNKMEVAVEAGADKEYFKHGSLYARTLIKTIFLGILLLFIICNSLFIWLPIIVVAATFVIIKLVQNIKFLHTISTPYRYMQAVGKGILEALKQTGNIQSRGVSIGVDESEDLMSFIYMKGGSEREKDVFAKCVYEFFGKVEKQRYLLRARGAVSPLCRYYCVPELLGKRKEDAEIFQKFTKKYIGNYELYYTRSKEGKQILLAACLDSMANKGELCVDKKKKVISAQ